MDKYLFGNINKGYKSGRWSNNDVNRKFRWLSNKIGKRIHPHLLRTSFSCNRQIEGMSLPAVSAILGHSNARVTERYTGVMHYAETKEVYEKFTRRFKIDENVKNNLLGIDSGNALCDNNISKSKYSEQIGKSRRYESQH